MEKTGNNILVFCESKAYDILNIVSFKKIASQYNIIKAFTLEAYKTALSNNLINCVLVCSCLADKDLVKTITKNFLSVPHIALLGKADEKNAQILLNKGLKDYIPTEITSRLLPAINREVIALADRKRADVALFELNKSKETLDVYFEEAPIATISWDLNFNVLKWNKSAVALFGYTANEAIGKNCLDLTVPKGLEDKALNLFEDLLKQNGITDNINETLTKNGEIKICHWHNTILKDKAGKTTGVISMIEDITEKRAIHNKVLRNQQFLEQAQKLSEVYNIEICLVNKTIYLSKSFIQLSGLETKKFYEPKYLLEHLIYPEDKIKLLRAFFTATKNDKKLSIDIRVVFGNNDIRWVNILAAIFIEKDTNKKSLLGTFIDVTDRKNELLKLQEQKHKLDLTINIVQLGFLDFDIKENTVELSGKASEIFGLDEKRKVFKYTEIIKRIHPQDRLKAERAIKLAITKQKPYQFNHRVLLPNGEVKWLNAKGNLVFDSENNPVKLISIAKDITKQVTRERRLLQHSLVLNQLNSLVLVLDGNTDFIFASSSIVKMTGYSIEDVLGQGWWNLSYISESEKVKSKNYFSSILEKTQVINSLKYERKVLCKDGSVKWFSWQFSRGAEGTIIGLAYDITKEKEKEYLVTKLFKAIENSPTIVIITGIHGNIEYVNPKFEEVTGYTSKEVVGQNPRILKSGTTSPKEYRNLWDTISKGETWRGELKNKKKDGSDFWEKAIITPVKNDEGVITNYIALKEDITEIRAQEKKFLYALFEAQENEKLKFGEELHDSLSQILSAMSFYLEAVLNPKNTKDHLKVAYLEKVRELSADALRESRHISHGLMSKQLLKAGLIAAINEICENYNVSRKIKFTFIHKNYNEDIFDVKTKQNIYRITQEITTNIIRHAGASKAGIKITIEDDAWFVLEIKDNGIGIDAEVVKEKTGSFGLTNIQQRVSLLNGHVKRDSKVNKGTQYNIRIPIVLKNIETESN